MPPTLLTGQHGIRLRLHVGCVWGVRVVCLRLCVWLGCIRLEEACDGLLLILLYMSGVFGASGSSVSDSVTGWGVFVRKRVIDCCFLLLFSFRIIS